MKTLKSIIVMFASIVSIVMAIAIAEAGAEMLSANQVIEQWDNREDGETAIEDVSMTLIDSRGKERVRQLKSFRKDFGEDSKTLVFFLQPADVRNIAYLTYDWDDSSRDDDSWLYLPSLKKVRRVASSDQSDSFVGSDFSYADVNGLEIEDWEFSFVKQNEIVDGYDTWVITGLPKENIKKKVVAETGYLKVKFWICKENFLMVKAKYWVKKGKKIKYFTATDIKEVNGIQTAHKREMVTTKGERTEHSTVIDIENVEYNQPIDDSMFTNRRMKKGL